MVFKRGTWKGLKGIKPEGGQTLPKSIAGERLLWKKAQKKDKKKKTSETINKIIPQRRPNSTMLEWRPCAAPSLEMSRHHWYITTKVRVSPVIIRVIE
jgi:hypothetical protein